MGGASSRAGKRFYLHISDGPDRTPSPDSSSGGGPNSTQPTHGSKRLTQNPVNALGFYQLLDGRQNFQKRPTCRRKISPSRKKIKSINLSNNSQHFLRSLKFPVGSHKSNKEEIVLWKAATQESLSNNSIMKSSAPNSQMQNIYGLPRAPMHRSS